MRQRSLYRRLGAAALLACCTLPFAEHAHACALDQKPSVSANGDLARINKQAPKTAAQLAAWTYFVFPRPYRAHQTIVLAENQRDVARTLSAEAMRQPWGWQFGDGTVAYGHTVRHAYTRTGHFPIRVYVWDPEGRRWDLFDQVTITIR